MLAQLGPFWTIPNGLSLTRVVLAVPITILILQQAAIWLVTVLLVLAASTDWLDGHVARRTGTTSEWGKVLDPAADKIAVFAIGAALVLTQQLPLWFLCAIAARDVLIVAGGAVLARGMGVVQASTPIGKAAVTAIGVAFLAAILQAGAPVISACVWAAVALLVASFTHYLLRYLRLRRSA